MTRDQKLRALNTSASLMQDLKVRCIRELKKEVPDAPVFSPQFECNGRNNFGVQPIGHNGVLIDYTVQEEVWITREQFREAFEQAVKSLLGPKARLVLERNQE